MLKLLLFGVVCALGTAEKHDKRNLFCKDPDTLKYHPVNSTWSSTTFCGNYSCKIKPKNKTITEYIPLNNDKLVREANHNKIMNKIVEEKDDSDKYNDACEDCNKISTDDRYLNTNEVNALAKFLYSVKRSELDNLIEVYNMVNEMNSGMAVSASEHIHDTIPDIEQQNKVPNDNAYNLDVQTWNTNPFNYFRTTDNPEHNMPQHRMYPKEIDNQAQTQITTQHNLYGMEDYQQIKFPPTSSGISVASSEMRAEATENAQPFFYPGFGDLDPKQVKLSKNYQFARAPNGYPILLNANNNVYPKVLIPMSTASLKGLMDNPNYGYARVENRNYLPQQKPYDDLKNYVQQPCPWKTPSIPESDLDKVRAHIQTKGNNNFGIFAPVRRFKSGTANKLLSNCNSKRKVRAINVNVEATTITDENFTNETEGITSQSVETTTQYTIHNKHTQKPTDIAKEFEREKHQLVDQISLLEKELRALEDSKDIKIQHNETMETYITTERCNLVSEPGFFRTGDINQPFPLCCPQRID